METDPARIIGHVQADAFCEGCGYNLHTQAVTRDERLDILICRCPECGRFSAAGTLSSARQTWLNRLGLGLLIVWVLFLVWLMAMLTIFHGVAANGNVQEVMVFQAMPTTNPATYAGYHYVLRDPPRDADEADRRWFEEMMIGLIGLLLGALAGGVVSVCMWHVRGWRRLLAFAPAVVGVGIATSAWVSDPSTQYVRDVAYRRMGCIFLVECAGVILGLWLGRRIARGVLSIFLPPKPRQHLAFLWSTDGKQLKP